MTAGDEASETFIRDGFVVLPRYLSDDDLSDAVTALTVEFPTADEFHDDVDPERNERFRDEFGGITKFPFTNTSLSLAAVHVSMAKLQSPLVATRSPRPSRGFQR